MYKTCSPEPLGHSGVSPKIGAVLTPRATTWSTSHTYSGRLTFIVNGASRRGSIRPESQALIDGHGWDQGATADDDG
jgi:hypothetical protein